MHVHVLQFGAPLETSAFDFAADLAERRLDRGQLVLIKQADLAQHPRMRQRGRYVMRIQPTVKAYTFGKLLQSAVGRFIEYTAARWTAHARFELLLVVRTSCLCTKP